MQAWDKATQEELKLYTDTLRDRLLEVICLYSLENCQDLQCEDRIHCEETDRTVLDILCSMVETSYTCLPLTGQTGGGKIIPGWSVEVAPFRKESNACYHRWQIAGKHAVCRIKRESKLH